MRNKKVANLEIGCNVSSCAYHCDDTNHCSLPGITIEACRDCHNGCAEDESMCGSYRHK